MSSGLRGKRILVTGATDGIGRAAVTRLVHEGAHVIVHGRDPDRVRATMQDTSASESFVADLSSLAEVRDFAGRVAEAPPLDVLVNNAGIGAGPDVHARQTTIDGHELRFAVNYLAPFLLTEYLLVRTPPAAVVNVASLGQEALDFDDLGITKGYDGWVAYRRSKLAMIMWTFELAARLPVAVNALHPGTFLATKMVTEVDVAPLGSPDSGGDAVVELAKRTLAGDVRGAFFDVDRPVRANAQAYDASAQQRLLAWSRVAAGIT